MFTHHYVPHVLALFVLLHLQKNNQNSLEYDSNRITIRI